MTTQKRKIWGLIARISLRGALGLVLITVLGGSLVLHLQPGSLGIVIPMGIAFGLIVLGIGINSVLSSIPITKEKYRQSNEERRIGR